MVPGGHLSVILVVIIGFRQLGVRKAQNMAQNWSRLYIYLGHLGQVFPPGTRPQEGQNMAQTWPRLYIYTKLLALKPSRGP